MVLGRIRGVFHLHSTRFYICQHLIMLRSYSLTLSLLVDISGVMIDINSEHNSPHIYPSKLSCDGTEDHLVNCNHAGDSLLYCESTAVVYCAGINNFFIHCLTQYNMHYDIIEKEIECDGADNSLRLFGDYSDGRVVMCIEGLWVAVCDDNWGNSHADVVCRQLGHNGSKSTVFPYKTSIIINFTWSMHAQLHTTTVFLPLRMCLCWIMTSPALEMRPICWNAIIKENLKLLTRVDLDL